MLEKLIEGEGEAFGRATRFEKFVQFHRMGCVAVCRQPCHRVGTAGRQDHMPIHTHGIAGEPVGLLGSPTQDTTTPYALSIMAVNLNSDVYNHPGHSGHAPHPPIVTGHSEAYAFRRRGVWVR